MHNRARLQEPLQSIDGSLFEGRTRQMAEGKEEIATSEIREKILSELDSVESAIAEAWRKYDQEKKGA